MADKSIEYIYALIDKYSPVVNNMSKHTKNFSSHAENSFSKVIKKINLFGINVSSILSAAGIIQLTKQVVNFGKESIKAFEQQDEANRMIQKSLEITGFKSGKTFDELSKTATDLQSKTFFGDESIMLGATASLLSFTSIAGKEFDRIQKLTLDVTAKMKGTKATQSDLATTARYLAMAYEKPEMAMRTLRMMNIMLSNSENDMIQDMIKNGEVLKAREFIIQKVESRYSGMAESMALSSAGLNLQTKNMIGDMQEVIGEGLIPLRMEFQKGLIQTLKELTPVLILVTKAMNNFFKTDWKYIAAIFNQIKNILRDLFLGLEPTLKNLLKAFRELFIFLSEFIITALQEFNVIIQAMLPFIRMAVDTIANWIEILSPLFRILKPVITLLVRLNLIFLALMNLPILLGIAFSKLFSVLVKFIAKLKIWGIMWDWIKDKIKRFTDWIKASPLGKIISAIFKPIIEGWEKLKELGKYLKLDEFFGLSRTPKEPTKKMPSAKTTAQKVDVKNSLDINVKAEKGSEITKINNKNNLGTQRKKFLGVF